jgi:hypothetical protein
VVNFIGGGNWRIQRKKPTCRKWLINFITYVVHLALIEIQTHNINPTTIWSLPRWPLSFVRIVVLSQYEVFLYVLQIKLCFLYFRFPIGRHCHGSEGRILRCWYQGFFRVFWEMAIFVCLGIFYRQKSKFGKITLCSYSIKGIQAVRIEFFVYTKSCQYSMFYTNCSWNFS